MLFDSFADNFGIATKWVSNFGSCLVYDPLCHAAMNFQKMKFGLYVSNMLWTGSPPAGNSRSVSVDMYL